MTTHTRQETKWAYNGKKLGSIRNGIYYIRKSINGRQITVSTHTRDPEKALEEFTIFENNPTAYRSTLKLNNKHKHIYERSREEINKDRDLEYRLKNLRLTINAYGGKCHCCGEIGLAFLTIGHKFNNGPEDRIALGLSRRAAGSAFYRKLIKLGFPQDRGYVVECYNCNCGSARNGGRCPHVPNVRPI